MKYFPEALKDGFEHISEVPDKALVASLRDEGILIDSEGYYRKLFGEHKEFELRLEPIGHEGTYYVALYRFSILLTEKLPMKGINHA